MQVRKLGVALGVALSLLAGCSSTPQMSQQEQAQFKGSTPPADAQKAIAHIRAMR